MRPSFFVDIRGACLAVRSLPTTIENDEYLQEDWPDVVDYFEGHSDVSQLIWENYPEHIELAEQLCEAYNRSMYRWDIDVEVIGQQVLA